ncbi:MAG: O-antigen ligase family protein [Candidatus Eisenbacteria bacterium]|nr:O-antigen ligase family protein [Candidatus Eisenbacteria bacterium]
MTLRVGWLALLAFSLPFELKATWFSVGPVGVTNLECLLLPYILWAATAQRGLKLDRIAVAGLAWIATLTASSLLASQDHLASLRFTGRLATAVLVFLLARRDLTPRRARAWVLSALLGGGMAAALLGILETFRWADFTSWMHLFRDKIATVNGELRLTSSWQHANTAAGALELLAVLAGAEAFRLGLERRWDRAIAFASVTALLTSALFHTLSRGGMVAALSALVLVTLLTLRTADRGLRPRLLVMGLVMLAGPPLFALASNPILRGRLTRAEGPTHGVAYAVDSLAAATMGEELRLPVRLHNTRTFTWRRHAPHEVNLSYHLLDANQREVVFDGPRTPLPRDVRAGEDLVLSALVVAPKEEGDYVVLWDLVQEGVSWFSQMQNPSARTFLSVRGERERAAVSVASWARGRSAQRDPWPELKLVGRSTLWPLGVSYLCAQPLLGIGPDQFRHRYAETLPGEGYDPRLHANSLYIESLATTGLLGTAGLACWIGSIAAALVGRLRRPRGDLAAAGGLGLLTAYLVHGLLDCMLEPHAVSLTLALGLAASGLGDPGDVRTEGRA